MTPTSSIAQKARALLEGVTEGPWFASDWNEDDGPEPFTIEAREPEVLSAGQSSIWPNGIVKRRIASTEDGDGDRAAHARLIASAPTLISEMADALEAAKRHIDELQAKMTCMCGDYIDHSPWSGHSPVSMFDHAVEQEVERRKSDALERAEAREKELLEALKPFADSFDAVTTEDLAVLGIEEMKIQRVLYEPDQPAISDLRRAKAALSKVPGHE